MLPSPNLLPLAPLSSAPSLLDDVRVNVESLPITVFVLIIDIFALAMSRFLSVVEKPPYEVTETGWGEFEVQIRIYFVDVNEKPVRYPAVVVMFPQMFTSCSCYLSTVYPSDASPLHNG